jgi:branched-chain amino acid transport system permease protein
VPQKQASSGALESSRPPRERGRLGTIVSSAGPLVLGIAIAAAMHFTLPKSIGLFYTKILVDTGIAIILAVSLNVVNGMTGQFSLGHAALMALGGYTAGMLTRYGSMLIWDSPAVHGGFMGSGSMLFLAACFLGGCIATVAGYVIGLPSLRLRGDYLAIVTLGFGEILRVVLQQTNGVIQSADALRSASREQLIPPPVGGAIGFHGVPKYTNLFWVYAFVALMLVVAFRLKRSSLGRAMISVREDEFAAQAMGVNVARIKVLSFMIAAFFAGLAGGLYAHQGGVIIAPADAGFLRSLDYVLMTVLGGRGSISGVVLAAILLTVLPEALREFDQYRLIAYALLLIFMMLLRPQGLFGIHEIWDIRPKFSLKNLLIAVTIIAILLGLYVYSQFS